MNRRLGQSSGAESETNTDHQKNQAEYYLDGRQQAKIPAVQLRNVPLTDSGREYETSEPS